MRNRSADQWIAKSRWPTAWPRPSSTPHFKQPEDRGFRGVGVEETRPLTQRRAVLRQHPLHDALEQRMARADELQVGVADHPFLVEGDLRVGGADLAATTLDVAGQLPQVGRNAADGPDALLVLDGRDGAAERAVCLDEELLDVLRHQPVLFALLLVGQQLAHVDVAGAERLVLHVAADAGNLLFVGREVDLGQNLGHRLAAGEPILHQGIELRGRDDLADHVVHPVAAQGPAHVVQLPEQAVHDLALAGVLGHEVEDHRLLLLAVAVDAAHALFQPVRIPRDVVVDHQRAELKVDAFARGFGGHQDRGPPLEELALGVDPFFQRHAAVDRAAMEARGW